MKEKFLAAAWTTIVAMCTGACAGMVTTFVSHPGFTFYLQQDREELLNTCLVMALLTGAALWAKSPKPRDQDRRDRADDK